MDVSLELSAGACVTLIGPNGAGKTTLLLTLMGLIAPVEGRVLIDGVDLRTLSARQRGRLAAYVPQSHDHAPGFRVLDVVAAGRFPHLSPMRPLSHEDEGVIAAALAQCGVTALAERPYDQLSGGERQKTLIAAALAQQPRVLLLDEPMHGLDPAFQIELVGLLREARERGQGPILVSHDLNLPAALGGRVVALRAGRVVANGPAAEVLDAQRLSEIYGAAFHVAPGPNGRVLVTPDWWERPRG
jgi:iron complex transport system ATP-binding protein